MTTPEHHDALQAARRVNEIPWPTALAGTLVALLTPALVLAGLVWVAYATGSWPVVSLLDGAR